MAKVRSQADRRKHATFTDQHGRKWFAVIEKDTMHPCSAITPIGWKEPPGCVVPDNYKTFLDQQDPFALTINYEGWINDTAAAHEDYDNRCATTAAAMSPEDGGARLFGSREDGSIYYAPALVKYIGPRPAPVELPRAMRAGNKWALGLLNPATGQPYPRPAWAEKFAPRPERVAADDADLFPDADDDLDADGDFEASLTEEEQAAIARDARAFPDEPEDRPEGEVAGDEAADTDDVFSHLDQLVSTPTSSAKPPRVRPTSKKS